MSQPRVLLVEDSPTFARGVFLMLQGHYQVTIAETLLEALVTLKQEQVAIILLDLMLPDSDADNTLKAVFQEAGTIPILVLCGWGFMDRKPFPEGQFVRKRGLTAEVLLERIQALVPDVPDIRPWPT